MFFDGCESPKGLLWAFDSVHWDDLTRLVGEGFLGL